ncbi:MAG: FAD-dependent oxidoreductase [Steroidobacteraceae bacterium]
MKARRILIIGGGIGGLTSAIALGRHGHDITVIEKDPAWSVYGVGIIQQSNVIRAAQALGILEDYLAAGVGFDAVEVFLPDGRKIARVPSHRLIEGCPANLGIGRPALHRLLGRHARAEGARVRLGVVAERIDDDGESIRCALSDGTSERFDVVIGADGLHSQTRQWLFPAAPRPEFTGQAVWRYNLPRSPGLDCLQAYNGRIGAGLVPLSQEQMYLFLTTPEPGNPRYPRNGLAAAMRSKLADAAPPIAALADAIVDDDEVVYRPLDWLLLEGPWHVGRIVLLGDAVHATTPHLGQGAGMAIEDSIVLAEEIARQDSVEAAFTAYHARRYPRCRYIVEASLAICRGQLGSGPPVDNARATQEMFDVVAAPL